MTNRKRMIELKSAVAGSLAALTLLMGGCATLSSAPAKNKTAEPRAAFSPQGKKPQPILNEGKLPLYFIENGGQFDLKVKFYEQGRGHTTVFTEEGIYVVVPRAKKGEADGEERRIETDTVLLKFLGANPAPEIVGEAVQEAKVHYLMGRDPEGWRTGIPTYLTVLYRELYPGIDVKFYGNEARLEYDLIVKPGADPSRVQWAYEGAESAALDENGNLVVHLGESRIVQKKPFLFQEIGGARREIAGRFQHRPESGRYGFEVAAYDRSLPLIIDPVLEYATYLGGSSIDFDASVAVDAAGNIYLAGDTNSSNFPLLNAFQTTFKGGFTDVFITKLNPAGSALIYSTYLGGGNDDAAHGIAVDGSGNAYVIGETRSGNFPTRNPFQPAHGNPDGFDAFVVKLNPAGGLVYSTFLGGNTTDIGYGIAVDAAGSAYVTGTTGAQGIPGNNFPTVHPFQSSERGSGDAFVAKFTPEGSGLVYSTYLGGTVADVGYSIALDGAGNAYVTGLTTSPNFPTLNPIQQFSQQLNPSFSDIFVTKLNAAGSALVYSTYIGGSGRDIGQAIAVDGEGSAYVRGQTGSTNLPMVNAIQPLYAGGLSDAFVLKVKPDGSGLVYSTYLGGSGDDGGISQEGGRGGIAVNAAGEAYVTGVTTSRNFPLLNPIQAVYGGGEQGADGDLFVTKFNATGSGFVYSTYLGGSRLDAGSGIALGAPGSAYVAGPTRSRDFPTVNAFQPAANVNGTGDVFVAKIQEPPAIPTFKNISVIGTFSTANIELDPASLSAQPFSITPATGQTAIEWRFPALTVNEKKDLSFEVVFKSPVPGENRPVNQKLQVLYTDAAGNPARTELGPQFVHVRSSAFQAGLSTDKGQYGANENVLIGLTATNLSEFGRTVDVVVEIEESQGGLIQRAAALTGQSFLAGETRSFPGVIYNTGKTFAGNYRAHLHLIEGGGQAAELLTSFTIVPVKQAAATVVSDKRAYVSNESVTLSAAVTSQSPNSFLTALEAVVTVADPSGAVLFSKSRPLADLNPEARVEFNTFTTTGTYPAGIYTATLQIKSGGSPLTGATTQFEILSSLEQAAALAGEVRVSPARILQKEGATFSYTLQNIGNEIDLPVIGVTLLIIDPDTQTAVRTFTTEASLNGRELFMNQIPFQSGLLAPKAYLIVLQGSTAGITQTLGSEGLQIDPIPNHAPIANAGNDLKALTGGPVLLDGRGSSDPDGDPLSFSWHFISVPTRSHLTDASLSNGTTPSPSFVPDAAGTYLIGLVVKDGSLNSQQDTVSVFVDLRPAVDIHPETISLKSNGGSRSITAVLTSPILSSFEFFTAPDGVTITAVLTLENRYVDKNGNTVVFTLPVETVPGGYKVVRVHADGEEGEDDHHEHGYGPRERYLYQVTLKFNRDLIVAGFKDANGNLKINQPVDLTSTVIGNNLVLGSDTNRVILPPRGRDDDR